MILTMNYLIKKNTIYVLRIMSYEIHYQIYKNGLTNVSPT